MAAGVPMPLVAPKRGVTTSNRVARCAVELRLSAKLPPGQPG